MSDARASSMATGAELFGGYERQLAASGAGALAALVVALQATPEPVWLDVVQRLVLRGRGADAQTVLARARVRFPDSAAIAFALAGLRLSAGRADDAEALLREALEREPAHAAAALLLADVLRNQARSAAAAQVLRTCFLPRQHAPDVLIRALEILDDCERKADAAALAEAAIAGGCDDPRIHAYAATYLVQLGDFARAHERYGFAHRHSAQAPEWDVPFGLAATQRYSDAGDADFAVFDACLQRADLSPRARATLLFGVGKAYADLGDLATAARHIAAANELARALWPWSRKQWRRVVDARLQAAAYPRAAPREDFIPVFVVGVPRSGTTLVAELLARRAQVCNRGESPWIANLLQRLPPGRAPGTEQLEVLAGEYVRQLRQDDAVDERWFIDKQPLNLVHVGFMLALFSRAKIVYCRRHARDTALSLWLQYFREPGYGFAYDFADIAALQQGCERLMAHWMARFPDAIRALQYEDLAQQPEASIAALAAWIGLPPPVAESTPGGAINTASVWQARQPVYTRSIGRWREWLPFVPELATIPDR